MYTLLSLSKSGTVDHTENCPADPTLNLDVDHISVQLSLHDVWVKGFRGSGAVVVPICHCNGVVIEMACLMAGLKIISRHRVICTSVI